MTMRWSLSKRIWLSFISLIVIVGLIVGIVYPFSLEQALKDDSFQLIEQEQLRYVVPNLSEYLSPPDADIGRFIASQQAERSVGHLLFYQDLQGMKGDPLPVSVYRKMVERAKSQEKTVGEYEVDYQGATLYYVVRKIKTEPSGMYLISYMWDTHTKQMVKKLWWKLIYVFLLAGAAALALAAWLSRYLKAPLRALGDRFEEIARLNWKKPFEWNSDDEFRQLSDQFEHMRRNLMRYDESQKQFLQRASHELKTPIMVIQSYAQSVKDGIYPADQLDETMDIIMEEAARMEKRVKKLLYFTRVDSLPEEKPDRNNVRFGDLAKIVKERMAGGRPEVAIDIEGADVPIYVDEEQWLIVLENLVENALRYAKQSIRLKAESAGNEVRLSVENDGEPIPEDEIDLLFEPFSKGKKGQFGLGLAIVKRIVERHGGVIRAQNTAGGVAFEIRLPSEKAVPGA